MYLTTSIAVLITLVEQTELAEEPMATHVHLICLAVQPLMETAPLPQMEPSALMRLVDLWVLRLRGICAHQRAHVARAMVIVEVHQIIVRQHQGVKQLSELVMIQAQREMGEDYCTSPDCQFNYGPACDANKIPSGTNTSSIQRNKVGSVLYGSAGIYDCVQAGDMALTFDDGPFIYTSHILNLLQQYNATATFFITGNNNGQSFQQKRYVEEFTDDLLGKGEIDNTSLAWPALIKRMYSEGHQVASHTWSHPDLSNITSLQRKNEMWKNEMALRNILGVIPTYMRSPYSSCTAESGCEGDLNDLGYHITFFNLDTSDYLNDSPTLIQNSKNIFDAAVNSSNPSTDEFLVIAHDIHNQTSQVLVEYMLQGLKAKDYKPVSVGTCLGDPMENWYRTDTSATLGS
ncbi:hypothetical protein G7Y89_g1142 [Cudoniella acicularis]|uniref:NodB homology domain-containing protein n=1 Tax=Cudoniella acicularis TaxID=354080 RepID=A0A8H4W7P4_9HELO|nr:hypothetical protein G7Y89_g1142 [Cudoniella acicularis]